MSYADLVNTGARRSGGLMGWISRKFAERAEAAAAKSWAKAQPKELIDRIVASVDLPDHLFRENDIAMTKGEYQEAEDIYRAYVDVAFSHEATARRIALTEAVFHARFLVWLDDSRGARQDHSAGVLAREAARKAEIRSSVAERKAEIAANDPTYAPNVKAHAEQTFLATGRYATSSGRVLSQEERFRLGLPSEKKVRSGLLDAQV